jgi:hypothetical protein
MHNVLLTAMCQGADSILSVLSECTNARKLRKGGAEKIKKTSAALREKSQYVLGSRLH